MRRARRLAHPTLARPTPVRATLVRVTRSIAWLCALAVCCGCASVMSEQPVGETSARPTAEDWDGQWLNPDGLMVLKVVDSARGALQAASVEDRDGRLELESLEVLLRSHGDRIFANILEKDDDEQGEEGRPGEAEPDLYSFALVRKEEDRILVWFPDVEGFKARVLAGELPGRVVKGDVILGKLTAEHLDRIAADEGRDLFDWTEPQVWFRFAPGSGGSASTANP